MNYPYSYNDSRDGIVNTVNDRMYVIDDYGNLIHVQFCLFQSWFQDH